MDEISDEIWMNYGWSHWWESDEIWM